MADNTTLNPGVGGDVLRSEDVGGGVKISVSKTHTGASGVDGGPVTTSNPFPVSGSMGLTNLGAPVSVSNALPVEQVAEAGGLILSGSSLRTVQYSFGDFGTSGSSNQVVAPQGGTSKVRLLSACLIAPTAVGVRWQSTGSGGLTNLSGLMLLPANGGFVLPHNPHGWFQTNANEGLNLNLNSAVSVGLVITWMLA